jgi:peptidoglycan L-alanyl-D-glutamate endopeptidase CwlK
MKGYSKRSLDNMKGLDPRLLLILEKLQEYKKVDLTIICGVRTAEEQYRLFEQGRTKRGRIITFRDGYKKKSNHQIKKNGFGYAIDFVPYPFKGWKYISDFKKVGKELKRIAKELGIKCSYGGDWKRFKDFPHFEIKD